MIEKIEIIRGPGSAIYGTYASLGVIRVTTKGADTLKGGYVALTDSEMDGAPSHRNLTVGFGKKISDDVSMSAVATMGMGSRSAADYVDGAGRAEEMANNFTAEPRSISAKVNAKGLRLNLYFDDFQTYVMDGDVADQLNYPHQENHTTYAADTQYDVKLSDSLTLTPRIYYKHQSPFHTNMLDDPNNLFQNHRSVAKTLAALGSVWDPSESINVVAGVETYRNTLYFNPVWLTTDRDTSVVDGDGIPVTGAGEGFRTFEGDSFYNQNTAVYAQALVKNDIANFTVGGRYETTNRFRGAFVPRLAVTKAMGDFHTKLMAAQSFRTPAGIHADRIPDGVDGITPEKVMNYEVELGYRLTKNMFVQFNVYDLMISNTIVYGPTLESGGSGVYYNAGKLGSRGVEAEYRFVGESLSVTANYAYYQATEIEPTTYAVDTDEKSLLAFPRHRFNVMAGYRLTDHVSVHPSVQFTGKKFGYTAQDGSNATLSELDSAVIANLNVRFRDLLTPGLDVNLGMRNILDTQDVIPTPYVTRDGSDTYMVPSIPVASRSVVAQLSYTQTF